MNANITVTKDKRRIGGKPWLVRWSGTYNITTGKRTRHSRSFARKIDAERQAQQLADEQQSGQPLDIKDITIEELIDKFIKSKKKSVSVSTIDGYYETKNRFLGYFHPSLSVKQITKENAEQFINNIDYNVKALKKKGSRISDSTISRQLRQSNAIFNKAVAWGYIKTNPFEDVSIGKIRTADWHYISPEEFQSILKAIDNLKVRKGREQEDENKKIRLKGFYSVMYGCGLRFGEAINLTFDSSVIDFENNQIIISDRKATKTTPPFFVKDYESRAIPMPTWVVASLKKLKKVSENSCPYLFLSKDCFDRVSKKWKKMVKEDKADHWKNCHMKSHALKQFKRYCKKAGIKTNKKLNLHCLRKGYGTNLVKIGTPANTLQELMGHSSVLTSMKFYVNSIDANKIKAVEGLDRLMG